MQISVDNIRPSDLIAGLQKITKGMGDHPMVFKIVPSNMGISILLEDEKNGYINGTLVRYRDANRQSSTPS